MRTEFFPALTLLLTVVPSFAGDLATKPRTCFTPGEDCTSFIVGEIGRAGHSVFVQAYGFTSAPIAKALIDAKSRGVDVRVILDSSNATDTYSGADLMLNSGVRTYIDNPSGIAHNKVMVIDGEIVLTGSFNFTKAAQERNAENVLVITDRDLADRYARNWHRRQEVSKPYGGRE